MDAPFSRVRAMKSIPLLRGLPLRDLERLAGKAREVTHEAGDVIIKEGTTGSSVYLILSGHAEVRRRGARRRLRLMGPGDFFGELSIVSPSLRSASVIAADPLTVLVLQGHDFRIALRSNMSMAHKLVTVLAERLRTLTDDLAPHL